jgi:Integrase zinc binding domain
MCREPKAQGYSWSGMNKDAELFIKACWVCQKCRLGQGSFDAARKVIQALPLFMISNWILLVLWQQVYLQLSGHCF